MVRSAVTSDQTSAEVIILGYGNPARGDDALGPELLHLIERGTSDWGVAHKIKLITDYQLQIEHAADLSHCDVAVFVDASVAAPAPYGFERLQPQRDTSYTSHALSPAAVLQVFEDVNRRSAPPAFLLSIRGEHFELGDYLSGAARKNLSAAYRFMKHLLENPQLFGKSS